MCSEYIGDLAYLSGTALLGFTVFYAMRGGDKDSKGRKVWSRVRSD